MEEVVEQQEEEEGTTIKDIGTSTIGKTSKEEATKTIDRTSTTGISKTDLILIIVIMCLTRIKGGTMGLLRIAITGGIALRLCCAGLTGTMKTRTLETFPIEVSQAGDLTPVTLEGKIVEIEIKDLAREAGAGGAALKIKLSENTR